MSFLFRNKQRTPESLLETTARMIALLATDQAPQDEKSVQKSTETLSQTLSSIKFLLYGDGENDPKKENIDKLMDGVLGSNLLLLVLKHMKKLEFEARKDVAQIFNFALRQRKEKAIQYVQQYPEVLKILVYGYEEPEVALNCGSILRECIRHQPLCQMILNDPLLFNPFFEYVQLSTFDVASDAFASFKAILTKHKPMVSAYLEKNFDTVIPKYNSLLESKNYVTKRQSLKLLGELLLDRANFKVMMRYINEPEHLKLMMNLLRKTTKAIQFEAFHVFKIFVANPQKTEPIVKILVVNRDKLIDFLKKFQNDKDDDEQFNEEKRILLKALEALGGSSSSSSSSTSSSTDNKPQPPAPHLQN